MVANNSSNSDRQEVPVYDAHEQGLGQDLEPRSPATEVSLNRQARRKLARQPLKAELRGQSADSQKALDVVARLQAKYDRSELVTAPGSITALLYLRVSTKEQAQTGEGDDGYSILSQRKACRQKASQLGAVILGEYIDPGESARTARRKDLQRMLADVKRLRPTYLIVDKLDRLIRNREDDIAINILLRQHGCQLVSCKEHFDDSPSGKLLYGVMAEIAQFYSNNLAQEVMKGLVRKAEEGGTPYRAPLGYVNRRETRDGVERSWVEVDPVRGSIISWCFAQYATGEWGVADLTLAAQRKGLTSRSGKPVGLSTMHEILRNPYYMGLVVYQGIHYQGKHPALVEPETWLEVQDTLTAHNHTGEKDRKHPHYLRGSIFCSDCGARLVYSRNTGNGGTYEYYMCVKKKTKANNCRRAAMRLERVEAGIALFYANFQVSQERVEQIKASVVTEMASSQAEAAESIKRANRRRTQLEDERHKLLQAHYAGAVPQDLLAREMKRLTRGMADAEVEVKAAQATLSDIETTLSAALQAAGNCQAEYEAAKPHVKRQINQGFFRKLFIGQDGSVEGCELTEPFAALLADGQTIWLDGRDQTTPPPSPIAPDGRTTAEATEDIVDRSRPSHVLMATFGQVSGGFANENKIRNFPAFDWSRGLNEGGLVGAAGLEPATARRKKTHPRRST